MLLITYVYRLTTSSLEFFNNLEEVKKVIHADVGTGEPVCAEARRTWVLIVSSRIHASRIECGHRRETKKYL